jgi:hypothetical protein
MLAALCLAMVFAICLSSYIALCFTSLRMSTRSQMSSRSLEVAEMGLEQALYALNANKGAGDWTGGWTLSGSGQTESMVVTANGLVAVSGSPTPLNLGSSETGQVVITVSPYPTNGTPTITSTATVTLASDGTTVVRKITTVAGIAPVFVNAVAATTGTVQFQTGATLDSYDSRNKIAGVPATYATQNPGALPGALGTSAIVLSQDTSASATVALNNAVIYGYAVGNQTNSISYATNAYIGGYPTSTTSIDPTRLITNPPPAIPPLSPTPYPYALPYQPSFPEFLPNGSGMLPTTSCGVSSTPPYNSDNILSVTSTLGYTTSTLPTTYYASGINLTSGIVTIQGPVVLIVYGNVNIAGGQIQIQTSSIVGSVPASLTILLENGSMTMGDNGIVNMDAVPLPKRLAILSTTNNSTSNSVQLSINTAPFYGVIYFPNLPVSVTGSSPVIYGSIVGQSVTFTGSPTIHYDMALRSPDSYPSFYQTAVTDVDSAFTYIYAPIAAGNLVESVGP